MVEQLFLTQVHMFLPMVRIHHLILLLPLVVVQELLVIQLIRTELPVVLVVLVVERQHNQLTHNLFLLHLIVNMVVLVVVMLILVDKEVEVVLVQLALMVLVEQVEMDNHSQDLNIH